MSRGAMDAYKSNSYGGKYGDFSIHSICTPILFTKQGTIGSFIYKEEYNHISKTKLQLFELNNERDVKRCVQLQEQVNQIDYPLMVYKGYTPDNRELILVNLADKEQPQKIINLYDMQFICFVGHNYVDREAKIGFLAMDHERESIKLCWLRCHQPFEKKKINDLVDYAIDETYIAFELPIRNELETIKKAEWICPFNEERPDDGVLVIQTTKEIYIQEGLSGKHKALTAGRMSPLFMQRGYKNYIYFAEESEKGTDSQVNELKIFKVGNKWTHNIQEVLVVREGNIISLELDPENRKNVDALYSHGRVLMPDRDQCTNMLYVVDDKENMFHCRQKFPNESGNRYELTEELNLATVKDLTQELNKYKRDGFNRCVINHRCISLNDSNYSFYNGTSWSLNVQRADANMQDNEDKHAADDEDDEFANKNKHTSTYQVHSVAPIAWTSRQIIECSY